MSVYHSIKNKSGSTSSKEVGQKNQILAFPRASEIEEAGESEQSSEFKAALLSINPVVNLPAIQDALYEALFGFRAFQLRQILNVPLDVTIRESLSPLALDSLIYAENLLCQSFCSETDLPEGIIKWKIEFVAGSIVAPSARLAADYLRVDLITGEPKIVEARV